MVENRTIAVTQILLDAENPRHDLVATQREAILAIIDEQEAKLVKLAQSIVANGLNPLDRMLVLQSGKNFVVLEGNRRLAALKLLHNPALADGTAIAAAIKKVASEANAPTHVDCAIAPSRDAAKPWLVLRHTGEQEGAGVVPWTALASGRFHTKPGTQTAKAITFVDTVQSAYPNNADIQDALDTIATNRLTTLGRLVADPTFRAHLGIEDVNGQLVSHFPLVELEEALRKILTDVATHMSVTQLKTKAQRTSYLKTVPKPTKATYQAVAAPLSTGGATSGGSGTQTTTRRPTKPGNPFKDIELGKLDDRINAIVRELRKLDVDRFPNAAAVLARVMLELSVDQFIAKKSLATNGELKTRIKRCLRVVDPTDKDPTYQGVRSGLSDGTSILAVATLHGYVHNPNFYPTPTDVRGIVANLKPFVQAMNDLV
jgi:hypothetical protein